MAISKHNKLGMTLAEVLITLGIIGFVCAMTIPILIKNTQDAELKTAWKKEYSIANQAYLQAIQDNGGIGYGVFGDLTNRNGNTKFDALKTKLKVIQSCEGNTLGNCWAPMGVTPDSLISGSLFKLANQNDRRGFVTSDGMFWILFNDNYATIAVDTNGTKGPNQWGKDVLIFMIDDISISPSASDGTGNSTNFLLN